MDLVLRSLRGGLDVFGYLDEVPERRPLVVATAARYLQRPEREISQLLDAGRVLADVARAHGKDIDILKAFLVAALQQTETGLNGMHLNQVVEQLVDLPVDDATRRLAG